MYTAVAIQELKNCCNKWNPGKCIWSKAKTKKTTKIPPKL